MRRAGAELFAREGIDAVGINAVALAIGIPAGTGIVAYRKREALIHDILHTHLHDMIETIGDADDAHAADPPAARLEHALAALFDTLLANRDAHRMIAVGLTSVPAPARAELTYLMRLIVFRFYTILESAVPGLAAARELQSPIARGLLAAISDAALWFRDNGPLDRADYCRLLATQTIAGARAALAAYRAG